jgi:hypothetical protein
MEFRLTYQGPLPAAGGASKRAREKQAIREVFHPQLQALWQGHQQLETYYLNQHIMESHLGDKFALGGFRFVPLVCGYFNTVCALDILFLRRDEPGNLISSGGDIDNRIKVLFDALRIPSNESELAGAVPSNHGDRFYCVMEDDRLITQVKVTTDRLLTPRRDDEAQNDVMVIIHVTTISLRTPMM